MMMKFLKSLKKNVFSQAAVFFTLLAGYQLFLFPSLEHGYYVFTMIVGALIVEFLLSKGLKQRSSFIGAYITALIAILLCFQTFGDAYFLSHILVVILGIGGKNILKKYKIQFFNPMVLGAMIVFGVSTLGLLEAPLFAWQGASSSYKGINYSLFLNAGFGLYIAYKTRKIRFTITFFLIFLAIQSLYKGISLETLSFVFLNATLYFFVFCMILEPKTSPMLPKYQIYLGILLACILSGSLYFQSNMPFVLSIFLFNIVLGIIFLQKKYKIGITKKLSIS